MLRTLVRRVTVKTLDAVVDRARGSKRSPVRALADAIDRARARVGLDRIGASQTLPTWDGVPADQPLWDSDRKKLEKWRVDHGVVEPEPEPQSPSQDPPGRTRLPVVHPERSPFESLTDEEWAGEGPGETLEGDALVARVREVLDECRPMVQADGGDIELLDVRHDVVHVELTGNCVGCPSSQATLKQGIERRLRSRIPQIREIASPQLEARG